MEARRERGFNLVFMQVLKKAAESNTSRIQETTEALENQEDDDTMTVELKLIVGHSGRGLERNSERDGNVREPKR